MLQKKLLYFTEIVNLFYLVIKNICGNLNDEDFIILLNDGSFDDEIEIKKILYFRFQKINYKLACQLFANYYNRQHYLNLQGLGMTTIELSDFLPYVNKICLDSEDFEGLGTAMGRSMSRDRIKLERMPFHKLSTFELAIIITGCSKAYSIFMRGHRMDNMVCQALSFARHRFSYVSLVECDFNYGISGIPDFPNAITKEINEWSRWS